jgi:hypothetical protein
MEDMKHIIGIHTGQSRTNHHGSKEEQPENQEL